jgi:hypothetical protein
MELCSTKAEGQLYFYRSYKPTYVSYEIRKYILIVHNLGVQLQRFMSIVYEIESIWPHYYVVFPNLNIHGPKRWLLLKSCIIVQHGTSVPRKVSNGRHDRIVESRDLRHGVWVTSMTSVQNFLKIGQLVQKLSEEKHSMHILVRLLWECTEFLDIRILICLLLGMHRLMCVLSIHRLIHLF